MRQNKVKELRNQKGWSQSDLASLSGLSVKTIQRIEKCRGTPSLDSAKALASVFETDFADFLPAAEMDVEPTSNIGIAAPTESADARASFLQATTGYWQPAVIAAFMAATIGFLAQLYENVERLSADVSDLLTMRNIELAAVTSRDLASATSNKEAKNSELADFPGDQLNAPALQVCNMTNDENWASLLDINMVIDAAEGISTLEHAAITDSSTSSLVVPINYLRRAGDSPISLNSSRHEMANIQDCIPVKVFDAGWHLMSVTELAQNKIKLESDQLSFSGIGAN